MKSLKPQISRILVIGSILLLVIVAVVVVNRRRIEEADKKKEIASIGAEWEKDGLMYQADYVKLRQMILDVQANGGKLSDADLDWSLALLKNGADAISRTRVMGLLGLLGEKTSLPDVQKKKILTAIKPLLTSSEQLDQRYAARVEKALKNR